MAQRGRNLRGSRREGLSGEPAGGARYPRRGAGLRRGRGSVSCWHGSRRRRSEGGRRPGAERVRPGRDPGRGARAGLCGGRRHRLAGRLPSPRYRLAGAGLTVLDIRQDDLESPEVQAQLALHLSHARAATPAGFSFALVLSGLKTPQITVWTAWDCPALAASGALKTLDDGSGEVKSMRTAPAHLRRGAATA